MDRKKILFVITKSVWGGAGKYVYDLATNLPTDRFDVTVAAGGNGILFEKLSDRGIRTIPVPELDRDIRIGKEIRSFRTLRDLFEHEQPDIVHLNSSKVGGLGALAGRIVPLRGISRSETSTPLRKRIRIIFTVHGWGFLEDRPLLWRAAAFFLSWVSTLFQDKVILINSRDYAVAQKFISKGKLELIHNGLAPSTSVSREQARRFFAEKIHHAITPDTLLIGTIAELTENKGLSNLICAFSYLLKSNFDTYRSSTSIALFLIGEGEDRKRLEQKIRDLRLEDIVFLLGFVPDAAQYLSGIDIFVLPSRKEGLPYVVMEAMTVGLPIIASNVGGIPDLISHNETGILVPSKNPGALAEAIGTLVQNPERRAMLGKHASDVIKTKFSLRVMLNDTQSLYEMAD